MVAVRGWINRYTLCQMKRNKEMAKKTTETKTQQAITSVCGKIGHRGHFHPDGTYMLNVGKSAAGRTLDGRTHDDLPGGAKSKEQAK